jgi:hypothetical protein
MIRKAAFSTISSARIAERLLSGAGVSISPTSVSFSLQQAFPETWRLSYTNPMNDINQRHVAPACA